MKSQQKEEITPVKKNPHSPTQPATCFTTGLPPERPSASPARCDTRLQRSGIPRESCVVYVSEKRPKMPWFHPNKKNVPMENQDADVLVHALTPLNAPQRWSVINMPHTNYKSSGPRYTFSDGSCWRELLGAIQALGFGGVSTREVPPVLLFGCTINNALWTFFASLSQRVTTSHRPPPGRMV